MAKIYGLFEEYCQNRETAKLVNVTIELFKTTESVAVRLLNILFLKQHSRSCIQTYINGFEVYTPLHMAIMAYKREIFLTMLCEAPGKAFITDHYGNTILKLACDTNQHDIQRDIIKNILLNKDLDLRVISNDLEITFNLLNNNYIIDAIMSKCISKYFTKKSIKQLDFTQVEQTVLDIAKNLSTLNVRISKEFFRTNFIVLIHIGIAVQHEIPFDFTSQFLYNKCEGIQKYFPYIENIKPLSNIPVPNLVKSTSVYRIFAKQVNQYLQFYKHIILGNHTVVKHIANVFLDIHKINLQQDFIPLFISIQDNHPEMFTLLYQGIRRFAVTDYAGVSIMHLAATVDNNIISNTIIQETGDSYKYTKSYFNRSPIYYAIKYNKPKVFERIYDLQIRDDDNRLLIASIKYKCLKAFQILNNYNNYFIEVYFCKFFNNVANYWPLLCVAVYYGSYDICKDLLTKGAIVNCQTATGMSPLFIAVMNSDIFMINLLLKFKANLKGIMMKAPIFCLNPDNEIRSLYDLQTIFCVKAEPELVKYCIPVFEFALNFYTHNKTPKTRETVMELIKFMLLESIEINEADEEMQEFLHHYNECKAELVNLRKKSLVSGGINVIDLLRKSPKEIDNIIKSEGTNISKISQHITFNCFPNYANIIKFRIVRLD